MDRLAEMREYSAAFGSLDDQDFLAAGYTPEEVAAFRGGSQPPSLTPQDRSAMLGVTALDVESALADNLPPSEWENIVFGAQ